MRQKNETIGYISASACYIVWGAMPLYWKALSAASPLEILAHRILWSFVILTIVDLIRTRGQAFAMLLNRKTFLAVLLTGILIAVNWFVYIFAVQAGSIVQVSLGYYITPIVNVFFGVFLLRERLDGLKKIAVVLAAAGVAYLTFNFGRVPWISLILAVSFGLYGLFKKVFFLDSLKSLLLEHLLLPPALFIIIRAIVIGESHFLTGFPAVSMLLLLAGPVTAIPLLLFAEGAKRISMIAMGFLHYFSPTCVLLIGVLVYDEPFTAIHLISFGCIWAGLAVFSVSAFMKQKRAVEKT